MIHLRREASDSPGGAPSSPVGGQYAQGCNAGHAYVGAASSTCATGGAAYGNAFILPLIGGSGGSGGASASDTLVGAGGGAGGGAIRITSDVSITFTAGSGQIYASGGKGGDGSGFQYAGGSGSGGAIHLQAPTISNCNYVNAQGGSGPYSGAASVGRIRMDATTFSNCASGYTQPAATVGPLVNVPLPVIPTVRVTNIDGIPVPANPQAQYTIPDVSLNKTTPITIALAASDIPLGTQLTLYVFAEGPSTTTDQAVTSTALAGTLAISTATTSVTLPPGVSRIQVRAIW